MEDNKFKKRDYKFKSEEGAHGGDINKWIIIIGGAIIVLLAYFFK